MDTPRFTSEFQEEAVPQITAASLFRKVWINGRMSTVSQWASPAPENQRITRLLNHLTAVCGMNA